MSGKKRDAFSEAIVGAFMLAVLALLVYFTIIISGVDVLHGRTKVYANVTFRDVGGLKDHDNVMYRGMKVGTVDRIELAQDALNVVIEIDRDVVLRESCRISVCDLSMLGGHYLLLEEGEGEPLPLETTAFTGDSPIDLGRTITHAARKLDEVFSDPKLTNIVSKIDSAADDIASVVASVKEGKGTVGKLLSDDGTVYDDLRRTLSSAADVAERLKNGEGLAGRLLAEDDPISGEFEEAVKSFRRACDSLDMKSTVASAEKLLDNLNIVAERLKNGEGTMGRLLADEGLYNEVDGLAKDVRQVLDNFRDTTPISTFGSLIMGGL